MSKKKQTNPEDEQLANVENALSASELFFEQNQKKILYAVSAVIVIVLAVLAFRNFYLVPKEDQAANEIYKAQAYFAVDSFRVALEGDGVECIGFEEIASEYSITKSGNLACLYAGICNYKLGNYEEAANYLKKFDANDLNISASALQLLGDSYVAMNEPQKAISCYEEVAGMNHNIFSPMSLKKAGITYEEQGNYKAAEKAYLSIKDNYPQSPEASDIDKYIARVRATK